MLIIQYWINMNFVISRVIVANNEYATVCEPNAFTRNYGNVIITT